jgi:hypothetical protein
MIQNCENIPDVALLDENTSVVDGLCETELVDAGLKAALQEIFNLEGEHVIELHAGFVEDTDTDETANEGVPFEQALGVLFVEGEKLTGGLSIAVLPVAKWVMVLTEQHDGSWTR